MPRERISAILITKNEERAVDRCLASLAWVDEVVMVDSGSTDRTLDRARSYANVRVIESDWLGFAATKQLAVTHARNDWILWVDADEVVGDDLRDEILSLSIGNGVDAYDMPRKTFFLGEWVKHTGWYPSRVVRLFNKKRARFNENILHEGLVLEYPSRLAHLRSDLLHYSYTSLYQYFDKMNVYGKYGAEEMLRRGRRVRVYQLITNPVMTFVKFYVINRGFLDGSVGLIISIGSAFSTFIRYVNCYDLQRKGT